MKKVVRWMLEMGNVEAEFAKLDGAKDWRAASLHFLGVLG